MTHTNTFNKREELINTITHGFGALLSILGLIWLIIYAATYGNTLHIVSFTVFGITMFLMYISSTLLHAFPEGSKVKDLFQIFDHSSIYFFIAGTYTPFLFLAVKGSLGWTLFAIVWGMAIGGTIFKSFFVKKYVTISTIHYILMGWLIVFAWKPLTQSINPIGLSYLVLGGVVYTIGAIFYLWRGFKYNHALWHIFVIIGSVLHFFSVLTLLE